MSAQSPKVFISYSHDSPEHKERVLRFAKRLRNDGVDAQIDQYVGGRPPGGWPSWMWDRIDWAEFVLLICTETYYQRLRGHEQPEIGKGAGWEGQLITLEIYNTKSRTTKFVPVIFDARDRRFIPEPLSDEFYLLDSEDRYRELYGVLTGQAGQPLPPLGPTTEKPKKEVEPLAFGTQRAELTPADESRTNSAPSLVKPTSSGDPTPPAKPSNLLSRLASFMVIRGILTPVVGVIFIIIVVALVINMPLGLKKPTEHSPTAIAATPKPALTLSQMQALWKAILSEEEYSRLVQSYIPTQQHPADLISAMYDNERLLKRIKSFAEQVSDPVLLQLLGSVTDNLDTISDQISPSDGPSLKRVLQFHDLTYMAGPGRGSLQVADHMRLQVLGCLTEITKYLQLPLPDFLNTQQNQFHIRVE
jgi:hypothetical protein